MHVQRHRPAKEAKPNEPVVLPPVRRIEGNTSDQPPTLPEAVVQVCEVNFRFRLTRDFRRQGTNDSSHLIPAVEGY